MALFATEKNLLHDPATRQFAYKKWLVMVLIAALLAAAGLYVRHNRELKIEQASMLYQELMEAVKAQNKAMIKERGKALIEHYADTLYGQISALMLAKEAVDGQDLDGAVQHLSWAARQSKFPFAPLARVRLARVYFAQDKPELARKVLEHDATPNHSLFEEVQADYMSGQGDWQNARLHYQKALAALPRGTQAPWIETKLSNLVLVEKP